MFLLWIIDIVLTFTYIVLVFDTMEEDGFILRDHDSYFLNEEALKSATTDPKGKDDTGQSNDSLKPPNDDESDKNEISMPKEKDVIDDKKNNTYSALNKPSKSVALRMDVINKSIIRAMGKFYSKLLKVRFNYTNKSSYVVFHRMLTNIK